MIGEFNKNVFRAYNKSSEKEEEIKMGNEMMYTKMINTIKRKILPLILAGGLLSLSGNAVKAEENAKPNPKVNASITRIETDQNQGINRAEIMVRDLPFNSDIYTIFEDYGDSYFNKSRIQSIPIRTDNLGLGIAAQHKTSSFFDPYSQIGVAGRVQGSPTKKSFGKIDLRYFPKEKDLEAYAFLDTKRFYFDIVTGYNIDSKNAFVMPGVDYKIHKNVSMGLETSLSGKDKLEKDYVGLRLKLNF